MLVNLILFLGDFEYYSFNIYIKLHKKYTLFSLKRVKSKE